MVKKGAIETRYKGYHFRSRLEARWALFLDCMATSWEYEKEGFLLSNGERYLPDFWLPSLRIWLAGADRIEEAMGVAKRGDQEVRLGEVFVECAEKTEFPGFGFPGRRKL